MPVHKPRTQFTYSNESTTQSVHVSTTSPGGCGGGAHNPARQQRLKICLKGIHPPPAAAARIEAIIHCILFENGSRYLEVYPYIW